ncbi:MAG TPA: acetyltransferase [Kofleriaceae bacterium]|nr:acetyltransferase [Kofleriaceae bacterium]
MSEWRVFVYGASGHGKVVLDVLRAAGVPRLTGFVDDGEARHGAMILGLPVMGDGAWLARQVDERGEGVAIALGIGDNQARHLVSERCRAAGIPMLPAAVHPRAAVAASASAGVGTVVMAGAIVNPDARIGEGVIVNSGAVIEHDCVLGDFAHISPNAALGGGVSVGAFTHVGLGASVLPGVRIGARAIVGAGATVTRDLGDAVVAVGVPARVIRRLDG